MIESRAVTQDDIEVLTFMLENEKRSHCRTRSICFILFLTSFLLQITALGLIIFLFLSDTLKFSDEAWLPILQILAPLSAAVIGFFASWCAVQNCINSIERSLYAAHAGRHSLFAGFLNELQCTSKKKRRVWMDMFTSMIV